MFSYLEVGLEEAVEGSSVAGALVRNTGLVGLREELDGGESADAVLLGQLLVGCSVNLGNDDVAVLVVLGELLPCGGHADAVAAPRGEELDKDVLGRVVHDGVVVLGGQVHNASSDHCDEEGCKDDKLRHFFGREV